MTPSNRQAPVVAELGRPETPAETAARTAQSAADRRSHQTVTNLIYSLIAVLALVLVIVLMVPRSAPPLDDHVDYAKVAAQGQGTEPDALASPVLPSSWSANSAQLRSDNPNGIDSWYIGLITPSQKYLGFTQGFKANQTWLSDQTAQSSKTGSVTLDGVKWTIYDNRTTSRDVGNVKYAMSTTAGASTYLLVGTASIDEFHTVATALTPSLEKSREKGGASVT
jgi:hypothetical protein